MRIERQVFGMIEARLGRRPAVTVIPAKAQPLPNHRAAVAAL